MSPTASVKHPPARARGRSRQFPSAVLLIGGALLVALVAIVVLIPSPHFVHRITIANPSPYNLDVEVSSGPREGWMALGTVGRNGRTDVNEVFDIGDAWFFRYSTQGDVSRTFRMTRAELAKDDWQVRVPDAVGVELQTQGVPPQP